MSEREKSITHLEVIIRITLSSNRCSGQFWGHYCLAQLSFDGGRFDGTRAHVECAKPCAVNDTYRIPFGSHDGPASYFLVEMRQD